ncbi:MAG: secretin N-terminal domain-containing protein, partial [Planctomycetota bacterium]
MTSHQFSDRRLTVAIQVVVGALILSWLCWPGSNGAVTAEPEFVGSLALAVEDDVARLLELTAEQKAALLRLINAREDEALELALRVQELPPDEREQELAPFRRVSEQKGLELLSAEQRERLAQIRVQRAGLSTLSEPEIAGRLELTDEQRAQVAELLRQRAEQLAGTGRDDAHVIQAETERALAGVLNDEQRAAWELLSAGPSPPEGGSPAPTDPAEVAQSEGAEASESPPAEMSETSAAEASEAQASRSPERPPELTDAQWRDLLGVDPENARLTFNFRYHPWEDVLDWFAQQAGLSLLYEDLPQGTCNYVDPREYTTADALDVLNSLLLIKGYTLVRRERMLVVINVENGIPPNLVTKVAVEDLDERGEYELVCAVFQLDKITAEEAQAEIEKLIGPQGSVVVLSKAQEIVVTETAGRLRTIRDAIQRIEDPEGLSSQQLRSFPLDLALAEDVLAILRQLFGIPPEENADAEGSIRLVLDPIGMRLIAFGKPNKLDQVAKVIEAIGASGTGEAGGGAVETALQLEVYNVAPADPEAVLKVIQTLLQGSPGVRLSTDPKTGNLIALAPPGDQATIRATLDQLRNDASAVEVVQLRSLDPQVAVLSITKLFGGGENSPLKVDADPATRRLVMRGPETVLKQIRAWLEEMGEGAGEGTGTARGENVRMLPLSGWAAESALVQLQELWPTMRTNKIRVVTPSAVIPTLRASAPAKPTAPNQSLFDQFLRLTPPSAPPSTRGPAPQQTTPLQAPPYPPAAEPPPETPASPVPGMPESPDAVEPEGKSAKAGPGRAVGPRVIFASETVAAEPQPQEEPEPPQAEPTAGEPTPVVPPAAESEPQPHTAPAELAPILVAPGPGGIMIASEDIEALNAFEDLITALASGPMSGTADLTVFYIVHAKAPSVAQTLDLILGGGTLADETGSPAGSMLGDLAGAAFGDAGGLVGSLLGLGGGGTIAPSGSVQIIPDSRLNALVVRANPTDTGTIRQLLEILDQPESPEEVLAQPKARPIRLYNMQADEVAEIVKQVYQERMGSGSGGGGGRQPSPQEFIEAA